MDKPQQPTQIAIFAITEEQWEEFQVLMEDASSNFETWEEWNRSASKFCLQAQLKGIEAVRMPVDLEDFSKWCRKKRKRCNAESRAEYVGKLLKTRNSTSDNI